MINTLKNESASRRQEALERAHAGDAVA